MTKYTQLLTELGNALGSGEQSLDYANRIRIERALFVTAKAVANCHLGLDLSGFSVETLEKVEQRKNDDPHTKTSWKLLLRAFELRAALARLTSSDPYVAYDDQRDTMLGRSHAITMFAKRLKRHGDQLATLDECSAS